MRRACLLVALLIVSSPLVWAQVGTPAQTAPAAQPQQPRDALGRDTPRGTVLGFMGAAGRGNDELAPLYLDTTVRGQAAVVLAHQLYVVLDSRLPARLNQLSDRPEGLATNPLKPDQNIVGTISLDGGSFDVIVERVTRGKSEPVWLFSRATLSRIPDAYAEVDLVRLDRFLPESLAKPRVFGIRVFDWLVLVLIIPLLYRLLAVLNWPLKSLVAFGRRRFGTPMRRADQKMPGVVRLVVIGIAIRWLLTHLELSLFERQFWSAISGLLLIVALGWSLLLITAFGEGYFQRRLEGRGEAAQLLWLARRGADVLAIAFCLFVVLRYFGFDPTAALAGLGIGGIAVALAAQKTLENVVAGLSLIFDKAVVVGDVLKFGDVVGTVDGIGLRSTRIRTLDRTILSVPNGQIASVGIETLSVRDKFWFHHVVGLRYGTTAEQMRAVIENVQTLLLADASVEAESVRVRFLRLGSFSLDVEVFAYVCAADWTPFLTVQQDLLLRIMEAVEDAGTAIAIPSQTLHIAEGQVPAHTRGTSTGSTPSNAPPRVRQPA